MLGSASLPATANPSCAVASTIASDGTAQPMEMVLYGSDGGIAVYDTTAAPGVLQWPPVGHSFPADVKKQWVSGEAHIYTWSLSGTVYGDGTYTATASSISYVGGGVEWPASGLFDYTQAGVDGAHGWSSNRNSTSPQWVAVSLPQPVQIVAYDLQLRTDGSVWEAPRKVEISTSDDGEAWEVLSVEETGRWRVGETRRFYVHSGGTAEAPQGTPWRRHFRLGLERSRPGDHQETRGWEFVPITLGEWRLFSTAAFIRPPPPPLAPPSPLPPPPPIPSSPPPPPPPMPPAAEEVLLAYAETVAAAEGLWSATSSQGICSGWKGVLCGSDGKIHKL